LGSSAVTASPAFAHGSPTSWSPCGIVWLPSSSASDLAGEEGISINQRISTAIAEKLSAIYTERYLAERAARGRVSRFKRVLAKVPTGKAGGGVSAAKEVSGYCVARMSSRVTPLATATSRRKSDAGFRPCVPASRSLPASEVRHDPVDRAIAPACFRVAKRYHADMGQPVKLSESLVLDARLTGEVAERSIAGQIEFWAGLGRAVESVLRADTALALKKRGATMPLSACLRSVNTRAGQTRLARVLAARPYPHFEPAAVPGLVVKVDKDGTRTIGRFVHREFRAEKHAG
jgi:hypothetical protein